MEILSELGFIRNARPEQLLDDKGIESFLKQLPLWSVIEVDQEKRLIRQFTFADFKEALGFTQKIGMLAEYYNHHPSITLEWGKTTVTWWTHSIGGLHQNDFLMAYKTQELYENL